MKKFSICFLLVTMTCFGLFAAAQDDPVTLYGLKTYSESGGPNGIYTLKASPGAQPELYWADGDMIGSGGAVYAEGRFYVLTYMDFFGSMYWSYMVCDPAAKTYDFSMPEDLTVSDAGSAMTYDPSTGNIYSICIDATDTSKYTLSTMNTTTAAKTVVAPIERLYAMAATASGTIYGIGSDGNLYIVNKITGELTLVGPTGVIPDNNQSAVIDYKTNVMYWSAYTVDGGALYTVDITTGEAELISTYEDKCQLVGLYIEQTTRNEGAPASPTDITAVFDAATTNGTVSFVMPLEDIDGNELSGDLNYEVRIDNETLAAGTAIPGARVEAPVVSPKTGMCSFIVHVSGEHGDAVPGSVTTWVGPDTPLAVENCVVESLGSGAVRLSWTLPERGVNGGYVDAQETRYILDRGPYDEAISDNFEGTVFEETVDLDGVNPLMYMVKPVYAGLTGEAVISNTIIIGEYMTPPFVEDFTDPFRSLVFTTEDSNEDEAVWIYDIENNAMKCQWAFADTSDDWLISAPVRLEAGKSYSCTVTARSEGRWNYPEQRYEDVYAGNLGIYLGTEPTAASMTETLAKPVEITKMDSEVIKSESYTAENTGLYYFGIHHSGIRSIYYTFVNRVEVDVDESTSVAEVVENTAPSLSLSGHILSIDNPALELITVVAMDGRIVATVTGEHAEVTLSPGVYAVAAGSHTFKIAVK